LHLENTDKQLIQDVIEGDKSAFRLLYKKYSKALLLICLRYVKARPDAEDLLQESFIKIYKALKSYDHAKSVFYTWSKRIVINECLQHLRKKKNELDFDLISEYELDEAVVDESQEHLSLKDLTELIQKLPKGYRTVFNLYVVDGYKHQDISNILDISESTSKSQLRKAKRMLQGLIKKKDLRFTNSYA